MLRSSVIWNKPCYLCFPSFWTFFDWLSGWGFCAHSHSCPLDMNILNTSVLFDITQSKGVEKIETKHLEYKATVKKKTQIQDTVRPSKIWSTLTSEQVWVSKRTNRDRQIHEHISTSFGPLLKKKKKKKQCITHCFIITSQQYQLSATVLHTNIVKSLF